MTNEVKEEKTAFLFQTLDKFINEKINLIVGELKEDSSLDKEVAKKLGITTTTLYMYINGDGSAKEVALKILNNK